MAVSSLGSVIDASFIRSFQGLASSGKPALGARAAQSSATISTGLRFGARTFATAIQNFNAAISVVNLSEDVLKKVDKLTVSLVDIAQRATSTSIGSDGRRKLQSEFEEVVTKFRRQLDSTEINGIDYLSKDGLSTLFTNIGLDPAQSESLSNLLSQFFVSGDAHKFVSEETKGPRPPVIPTLQRTKVTSVTNSNLSGLVGGISSAYNVYTDVDSSELLNALPGQTTAFAENATGELQGTGYAGTVLATNPQTGAFVITSTANIGGSNPSGDEQLFLFAPNPAGGTALFQRQITLNGDGVQNFSNVFISSDSLSVEWEQSGVSAGAYSAVVSTITELPGTPTLIAPSGEHGSLSPSSARSAYSSGTDVVFDDGVSPSTLSVGAAVSKLRFVDEDNVLISTSAGDIYSYNFASTTLTQQVSDPGITAFTILANDSTLSNNNTSFFAYASGDTNRLVVSSYNGTTGEIKTRFSKTLGAGTVDSISLAYKDDGNLNKDRIEVGVVGTLNSLAGDSDTEMYRISEHPQLSNYAVFSSSSDDPVNVLDSVITTRSDAYRVLGDLNALQTQIHDNLKILDKARDYLANNVDLLRTTGFAFLNLSDQLQGNEDAAQVAALVATEIRNNGTTAQLAQASNLKTIASATVGLLSNS